ncbi:MAG: DNA cytosine methyltransferase [Prevotella sp.]|nr:DNA cytosine methyltransferase [Prevotella sp.]
MKSSDAKELTFFEDMESVDYSSIRDICASLNCEYGTPAWPDRFGEAIHKYIKDTKIPKIRTLSLFSGAGGLDIGFHDLGFDIIESVEIEKKFCSTLIQNSGTGKKFPSSKPNCIDIREYSGDNLGNIDFIIGGPPCQTFSAAGRRKGGVLGTSDARGVLFREYVRLLEKLQPKGFLFENVYGIVGAQKGEPWTEIKNSFSSIGYKLYYRILDAADYGVPQHRERLIIVGVKKGEFKFPRPTHGCDSRDNEPFYNAGTAISGLQLTEDEKKTGINGRFGELIFNIPPGLNYSFYTKELGHPSPLFAWRSKFSDFMYKADPDMPVRTIKAQGGQYTGPLHWDSRYFACSEFKRLQTFPDDYQLNGVRQVVIHQIGNSVPPQLARMLALAIRVQVFNTKFPFHLELLNSSAKLSFRKKKRELTQYYRNKAKKAIEELYPTKEKILLNNRKFYLSLNDKFKYIESEQKGDYEVSVRWSREALSISVQPTTPSNGITQVTITPADCEWNIPVRIIKLTIIGSEWKNVTAGWKVLDRMLIDNKLKADLIQLNGYYQYGSDLVCKLDTKVLDRLNIMQPIYSGLAVSKNLTTTELAQLFDIKESDVMYCAKWLRTLGYEIRNNHTNPQLPENVWLIPYKFPTLLPESVQLYKQLD